MFPVILSCGVVTADLQVVTEWTSKEKERRVGWGVGRGGWGRQNQVQMSIGSVFICEAFKKK